METNKTSIIEALKSNRDFKGIWIPKEIWFNSELTAIEKVLLAEIDSLDNDQHCTASNQYFADFLGCGVTTVSIGISKLEKLGYISRLNKDNRYRILKSNVSRK